MRLNRLAICIAFVGSHAFGQRPVSFRAPQHRQQIQADLYGSGPRAVLLAHGGRFGKESWKKQAQTLAQAGFLVLAIRFRGDTVNADGTPSAEGSDADNTSDVLAAVSYLRRTGAKTVFAIGASLGGNAVGNADARSGPGNIDRVLFLGSSGGDAPEKLHGYKLFIVARDDQGPGGPRLKEISKSYERAPEPKKLILLDGAAHAQFLFDTSQGPRLMQEILRFVSEP